MPHIVLSLAIVICENVTGLRKRGNASFAAIDWLCTVSKQKQKIKKIKKMQALRHLRDVCALPVDNGASQITTIADRTNKTKQQTIVVVVVVIIIIIR